MYAMWSVGVVGPLGSAWEGRRTASSPLTGPKSTRGGSGIALRFSILRIRESWEGTRNKKVGGFIKPVQSQCNSYVDKKMCLFLKKISQIKYGFLKKVSNTP